MGVQDSGAFVFGGATSTAPSVEARSLEAAVCSRPTHGPPVRSISGSQSLNPNS